MNLPVIHAPTWQQRARRNGVDPEVFFPSKGGKKGRAS